MEIPRDKLIEAAVAHSSHQIVDQENLGYYRTRSICSCGASWMTGDHEGDPDFYVEKALHELGPAAQIIADWARRTALEQAAITAWNEGMKYLPGSGAHEALMRVPGAIRALAEWSL